MADIANPSPHSCGILLPTVFQTVTANLSESARRWDVMAIAGGRAITEGGAKEMCLHHPCLSGITGLGFLR